MDYYQNLIEKIESLLKSDKNKALELIEQELSLPYVPRDILDKLKELKNSIYIEKPNINLSVDELLSYLYQNEEKQVYASLKLSEVNLRDYLEQISNYLKSDGVLEAKLSIVLSLIEQEINKDLVILKEGKEYSFNPSLLIPIEKSDVFNNVLSLLNDHYMKNPDKLILAKELLYKELFYMLPNDYTNLNSNDLFNNIINNLEDCFK